MARLCILGCRNFHQEVDAAIRAEGWHDVVAAEFPARCGRPPLSWEEMRALLPEDCTQVIVMGRACIAGLGKPPANFLPTRLLLQDQCFHVVAGSSLTDEAISKGGYLITPGWLANWRERIGEMGFVPEKSSEFFKEFATELVLFDTGIDAEAEHRLGELAKVVGLPATRIAVGLDHVRLLLAKVVLEWRHEVERDQMQEIKRRSAREQAERVSAMDVLARLAKTRSESEAIGAIEGLFRMLFAPATWRYVKTKDGSPILNDDIPADLILALRQMDAPYALTPSGQGFLLRIVYDDNVLGIIVIDHLAFPEHRDHYLNLALAMTDICALAISDARAKAELLQHQNHLEELVLERTAELATARDAAEAASRAKSVFLANMSHELRTPMNGVMGMIDLVLRRATDPKQIDWLNKSKTSAQHLLSVINDILDISKIESNRMALEEKDFSITQTIDDVLHMHAAASLVKGLHLSREIDSHLPDVLCGDAMRVKQILLNYVGNAIKFSEKGEIKVSAHVVEQDGQSLLLRIEVSDQGIGISQQDQERLFHAFTQADGSMTRKYGGTGLGLVISRQLALLMGGEAGVESIPGVGSTFWATMRLKKTAEAVEADPETAVDAETVIRKKYYDQRILVVDDEPMNREVAQFQLESADLIVDAAADGAEAIALASKTNYAAIFMDMQMPNINGLEATQKIRQFPGYRDIPIIAMTANTFAEDKAKCIEAGMNDFLIKPFEPDTLFSTLLRSLEQSKDRLH